jgi:DNA-binding SARP family transcriptional activator
VPADTRLELRFLGEMEVLKGGVRLDLPPSKKTRGLLAYLALTGRPHRRERLCELLWDVADDPRGALRWSLSRLRALVDEEDRPRIHAPQGSVSFDAAGAWIDVLHVRRRSAAGAGLEAAPVEELAALAAEFRGELLEGLDLDDFLAYRAWCAAEREEARKLHGAVLRALVARLASDPEAALPHARALAVADPLDEAARAGLIRTLGATGRRVEAEEHFEAASRLLKELGRPASAALEAARLSAREAAPARASEAAPVPEERPLSSAGPGFYGRRPERDRLVRSLDDAAASRKARAFLVTGEPGLGKSRLLDEVRRAARRRGGTVLEGRAFEAEAGRPFGPWADALSDLAPGTAGPGLMADVEALLKGRAEEGAPPRSRDRLFGAVDELLAERAAAAPLVLLALDDVHWLDAASAELLHFVARTSRHRALVVVLTAREGELHDNEAAQRTLRGLTELGLLERIALEALGRGETRALVAASVPGVDTETVFAESGGNPLLALELARSRAGAPGATLPAADRAGRLPASLAALIRNRVERLPPEAGDVLRWAAVLGRGIDAARLGALMALDLDRLLAALERLERHVLLRATGGEESAHGSYEFTHEVVARAVASELSEPRRRLMHQRVADLLRRAEDPDAAAADLAYHAALAGDARTAAEASVRAGRLFLRQLANGEAWAAARRGRRHAAEVAEPRRTALVLELLQIELQARRPEDVSSAATELTSLAERALDGGDAEHGRLAFHLLAYLRWEEGDFGDAQRQMLRAEEVSRSGDERERILAMAEAARCLVLLERDLPHAEALALEASARSARAGFSPPAIADAQGLLRTHQGHPDEAATLFAEARARARGASDAMSEFAALEHLVVLRVDQGAWAEARPLAEELEALGRRLREGSEAPFARGLHALARLALGDSGADAAFEAALSEIRVADAKLRLAYSLTRAARLDLAAGNAARARVRSSEAHAAARTVARATETLFAGVTLARASLAAGDLDGLDVLLASLRDASPGASAAARGELEALLLERADEPLRRATP